MSFSNGLDRFGNLYSSCTHAIVNSYCYFGWFSFSVVVVSSTFPDPFLCFSINIGHLYFKLKYDAKKQFLYAQYRHLHRLSHARSLLRTRLLFIESNCAMNYETVMLDRFTRFSRDTHFRRAIFIRFSFHLRATRTDRLSAKL